MQTVTVTGDMLTLVLVCLNIIATLFGFVKLFVSIEHRFTYLETKLAIHDQELNRERRTKNEFE